MNCVASVCVQNKLFGINQKININMYVKEM